MANTICQKDNIYNILDYVLACFLLALSSPLIVLAIFLVKIDSRGKIFYTQERYGLDKQAFVLCKFRTMKPGSENGLPIWGREDDPRSSRIGKFLRVTHIDELPQIINVLKGQMSLVGPRPERPYFAKKFEQSIKGYEERHKIKPGITGWSQINGLRADSSVQERTDYDLFYVFNRSLWFYFKIILLTPFAKPVKREQKLTLPKMYQSRVLSQKAEDFSGRSPLIVPIRNA